MDRALRVRRREQVEPELRRSGDERDRRGYDDQQERNQRLEEVVAPLAVERRRQDLRRVGEDRPEDAARRAALLDVALVETRGRALVEVREHELDRNQAQADAE